MRKEREEREGLEEERWKKGGYKGEAGGQTEDDVCDAPKVPHLSGGYPSCRPPGSQVRVGYVVDSRPNQFLQTKFTDTAFVEGLFAQLIIPPASRLSIACSRMCVERERIILLDTVSLWTTSRSTDSHKLRQIGNKT